MKRPKVSKPTDSHVPASVHPSGSFHLAAHIAPIVRGFSGPMIFCGNDGLVLLANDAFLKAFEADSPERFVGRFNILKNPAMVKSGILSKIKVAYSGKSLVLNEVNIPSTVFSGRKSSFDMGMRVFEISLFPGRSPSGKIMGIFAMFRDLTELKWAEAEVTRIASFPDLNPAPIIETDPVGTVIYFNPAAEHLLEELGMKGRFSAFVPKDLMDIFKDVSGKGTKPAIVRDIEINGRIFSATVYIAKQYGTARMYLCDVTEARRWLDELKESNRMLFVLSESNQKLVRSKSEEQLCSEVCRILVKHGGYLMAWVGYAENDMRKTVRPVSFYGNNPDYVQNAHIVWSDSPRGRGPTGLAIRTGRNVLARHIETDPAMKPWRKDALIAGCKSSIALPLFFGNERYGALNIYSSKPDSFAAKEIDLLNELASDISYGIHNLRMWVENRKYAEILKTERDKAKKYFDIANVMLLVIGKDRKVLQINRKGCQILGYDEKDIVGKDWMQTFIPKEDRKSIKSVQNGVLKEDEHDYFENVISTKNGERLIAWHNTVLLDEGGMVYGTLSSGEDITESKRAEAAIRESENRLRVTVEASNIGLWGWDIEKKNVWFSPIWKSQLGYEDKELKNDYGEWESRLHPEDKERTLKTLDNYIKKPWIGYRTDFRLRHKNGSYRWMIAQGDCVLDKAGKMVRLYGCHIDMTELKEKEEALHRSEEKLAESQKLESVGRLAGGVAHDFNNMLNVITGYASIIIKNQSTPPSMREDVEKMLMAAERAASLTHQLLAFSRKQMLKMEPVDVKSLIQDSVKMLRRVIGEDILISMNAPSNLKMVNADPNQLAQVFINLALNARDAMPEGGSLFVTASNASLSYKDIVANPEAREGDFIRIEVRDTGEGIPPEIADRVFDPFFTTKLKGKGTGLGLSVVHGIVKQHNGWINVSAGRGKGATFVIHLPALKTYDKSAPEPAPAMDYPHGDSKKILLVEDEEGVRDYVARILESNGFVVVTADCAAKAEDLFGKGGEFDMILSDVVLPDGNGINLAERLVARDRKLAAVFMSGYIDDRSKWSFIKDKGWEFLQKPFTEKAMLLAMKTALRKKSHEHE